MIKSFLRFQTKEVRKWLLLSSILLLFINKGIAGVDPPVIMTLDGSLGQVVVNDSMQVEDAKFFDPAYEPRLVTPYPLRNIITVEINENAHNVLQSYFKATVRLQISYMLNDSTTGTQERDFVVEYKAGDYPQKEVYIFSNCVRVKVKIIQLNNHGASWDIWSVIKITNQLQSLPIYNFNCDLNALQEINDSAWAANTDKDELPVFWSPSIGADEYDLEWTYIDSSALASGRYGEDPDNPNPDLIFDNNASRVTITGTSYNIPLIYDNKGHLFFRVRPVQWQPGGGRNEANWSSNYTPDGLGRFDYNGHERSLNWQATTTYAEEGKRKIVVQYFDGSLRGRQTVTKDNSTNTTVVAESFYDFQGRPVVQVLPAPTMNSIIKYNQSFNVALNSNIYDKFNYDTLPDPALYCSSTTGKMDTVSGAAQYYSPNNPLVDSGFNKYIPDAKGYPFTEVEYTQDNTGRVSRQSGVGDKFRIGGGFETKYFYTTADQRELDALFGTEVGDESHYFKTMVRDANGQYSVSYTDMHGRTVATALAGVPDSAKLDTLSSYVSAVRTEKISNPSATVIKDLVMENKKAFVVTRPGEYTFTYKLDPASLRMENCNEAQICYECLYDLMITISGDCNNQNFGGVPFDTLVRNFNIASIDTSCNDTTFFDFTFAKWLTEGSYEVTKKLSVSKYALDNYRDNFFLAANTCKTIDSFLNEQRQLLAAGLDCKPTCESCMESVGDWPEFWERYREVTGIDDEDTSFYKNGALAAYEIALEDCAVLCDSLQSEYEDIRQSMLMDMTPSGGQYANADTDTSIYSIFFASVDGDSPDTLAIYQEVSNYLDEDGNPDRVYDEASGTLVNPNQLSPEVFMQKFKLSWAKALLPHHPEYCKLVYYDDSLRASNLWDRRFAAVNTYAEAMELGYLNPTNTNVAPFSNFNGTGTIDPDPMASYASGYFLQKLKDSLTKFRTVSGVDRSMWSFASISVMCAAPDFTCYGKFYSTDHAFNPIDMCEGERDMAWRAFRQMYLNIKRNIQNSWLKAKCPSTVSATTLMAAGHQPHFTDAREMLAAMDFEFPTDTAGVRDEYQEQTSSYYLTNCIAHATQWWKQLGPCNFQTERDSALIVSRLVQICYEGSDSYHPYGASSTKPGSTLEWHSFEDFLRHYCDSLDIDTINYDANCNAFLIPAPKPYDRQVMNGNKAVYGRPDSCECDTIASYFEKYEASSGFSSFADYMKRVHGTSMSIAELNTLLGYCEISGAEPTCSLMSDPIYLPPAFQCYTGDVCASCDQVQSLIDEFHEKFPGAFPAPADTLITDSAHIQYNRLFEKFMNYRLGFAKSVNEYFDFRKQCDVGWQSESCDSLQQLVTDYRQYYDQTYGTEVRFYAQEGGYFSDRHQIIQNGALQLPDSLQQLPGSWYNNVEVRQRGGLQYCWSGGYTLEFRMRFMNNAGGLFYLNAHNCSILMSCSHSSFTDGGNTFGPGLYLAGLNDIYGGNYGAAFGYNGFDYKLATPDTSAIHNWGIVKLQVAKTFYRVYYNGVLVKQIDRDPSDPIINGSVYVLGLHGRYGNVDWIKMYDSVGNVKYFEDFVDLDYSARVDNDYFCPSGPQDCQSAFTTYFNQVKGTSYTYNQIDSIYQSTCNTGPNPCNTETPCNMLAQWQDEFKKYGDVPILDESGANIKNWRVNSGGSLIHDENIPLSEVIGNGVASMPATFIDTTSTSEASFHFVDTLCFDTTGFDISLRLKLPDSLLVSDPSSKNWSISVGSDSTTAGTLLVTLTTEDGSGSFVCRHVGDAQQACVTQNKPGTHFDNWQTVRLSFRDTTFRLYVGSELYAELPLTHAMTQIRYISINQWSLHGQVDYLRITDINGVYLFNEEFDDPYNLALPDTSIRCTDCDVRFVDYFNERKGSSYTLNQVDSIYAACSVPFEPCTLPNTPYLTLCGRAEPVFGLVAMDSIDNCSDSTFFIQSAAQELYKVYVDSLKNRFDSSYIAKCMEAYKFENFTVRHTVNEFHHTLYYYDQAGNLIKTVPPAGVHTNYDSLWLDSVYAARLSGLSKTPNHTLVTQYRYNTLNQVVAQKSPDGGLTEFWYDRLGRLALSRNAKQLAASSSTYHLFSYTRYDHLGRITEVGQLRDTATSTAVSDALTRCEANFSNWFNLRTHYRHQVTQTVYDTAYWTGAYDPLTIYQRNLRNRVSFVALYDTTGSAIAYNNAVFYTYDIMGNVDTLLNDYGSGSGAASLWNVMNRNGNRFKKIVYNYDLISGKVNTVAYQRGYTDQFFQRYTYDAENRLILAESSRDSVVWEREATYEYYKHGPLARMVLGQQHVQGIDYAYTLQGWLKGINSTGGTATHDMGGDGLAAGVHQYTARDALGVTLNYFTNEYSPIKSGVIPFPGYSAFLDDYKPLYNGNISSSSVYNKRLGDVNAEGGALLFYNYRYDQLNRLTGMDVYDSFDVANNDWEGIRLAMNNGQNRMKENVSYDANGNILSYRRVGANGHTMDKLQYSYYSGTNQLQRITDTVPDNTFPGSDIVYDIDNQSETNNYVYDAIGNLVQDKKEEINSIKWNVYGKITEITRNSTGGVPVTNIKYYYDAMGNRIGKVFDLGGNKRYTWYVRDAQGNVLSIYDDNNGGTKALADLDVQQAEQYLYGSSRLGMHANGQNVDNSNAGPGSMQFYSGGQVSRGKRNYELTNHLGNVLAVVTDKKIGVSSGGSLNDYYNADIVSATDYYPFGMAARVTVNLTNYTRFGFNGQEFDWEAKGWQNQVEFKYRTYDVRTGRFLSADPISNEYPANSPYSFAHNKVNFGSELEGLEILDGFFKYNEWVFNKIGLGDTWIARQNTSLYNRFSVEGRANQVTTAVETEVKKLKNSPGQYLLNKTIKFLPIVGPVVGAKDEVETLKRVGEGIAQGNTDAIAEGLEYGVGLYYGLKGQTTASNQKIPLSASARNTAAAIEALDKVAKRKAYAESVFKAAGKTGEDLDNLMKTINFDRTVKATALQEGSFVYRYERMNGKGSSEKHFFTNANGALKGARGVGFADESGYQLVRYPVTKTTTVMESTISGTNTKQYFSAELQNNLRIKPIEE